MLKVLRAALIVLASIVAIPLMWAERLPFYQVGAAGAGTYAFNISGCNGTSDDAAAINTVLGLASTAAANSTNAVTLNFPSQAKCVIASAPLNFTGFNRGNVIVNGNGATLYGQTSGIVGKCIVDALGSTGVRWYDLTIAGDGTTKPKCGFLIGRTDTTGNGNTGGNSMFMENIRVTGNFTTAACWNFSGEDVTFINLICANAESGGFELLQDGINHFNATSTYVTQNAPVDSPQSFNNNTIINGHFLAVGSGTTPVWSSGTRQHRYINTYIYTTAGATCVTLYNITNGQSQSSDWDIHCEGSVTDTFLVTGTLANPSFANFTYRDGALFASNSIFKLGGSATSASIQDLKIDIPYILVTSQATAKVFDAPSAWTVDGHVYSAYASLWNAPATFYGRTSLAGVIKDWYANATIAAGTGSPASAQTANVGSLWLRTDGGAGTTLCVKESGTGNTGWVCK